MKALAVFEHHLNGFSFIHLRNRRHDPVHATEKAEYVQLQEISYSGGRVRGTGDRKLEVLVSRPPCNRTLDPKAFLAPCYLTLDPQVSGFLY